MCETRRPTWNVNNLVPYHLIANILSLEVYQLYTSAGRPY